MTKLDRRIARHRNDRNTHAARLDEIEEAVRATYERARDAGLRSAMDRERVASVDFIARFAFGAAAASWAAHLVGWLL